MRTFGTEVSEHALDGDVDTQLRLCFCRIIFRGIAPSLAELTPYLRERVGHYVALYKSVIRPVMIGGKVYHHTPFLPLAETTPWCVLEYARPDRATAVAAVFRTSSAAGGFPRDAYVFRPRGLDPARRYEVLLDSQGLRFAATGEALAKDGIAVRLEQPQTSELLVFRAVRERAR